MILFYDADGTIVSTSTWTLANPAMYSEDGYLMIAEVGKRPLLPGVLAFDFRPDASPAMAALALEIESEPERFAVVDGALHKDGEPVALDYVPGVAAAARAGLENNATIVAFFDMTDQQLSSYVVTNFGYTSQQANAFVVLRGIIRGLARAAGVARR